MKFLGWMHQKLRPKSPETLKDCTIGKSCTHLSEKPTLSDHDYPIKPSFGSRYCSETLKHNGKSCSKSEDNIVEETSLDSFHGFLSIGTFGSEPVTNEPETPTFKTSLEETVKIKTEVTENDLKLIGYELEQLLEAAANEEGRHEPFGRNSQASIITFSGKKNEGAGAKNDEKLVVCPLQGYLFGSAVEICDRGDEVKKEKASLAELFQRVKISDENPEDAEIQKRKPQISSYHRMKKMVTKLNASTKSFSRSTGGISATTSKLKKVLRILHRKIHPEGSAATGEFGKPNRNKNENILHKCHCSNMQIDEGNGSPQGSPNNYSLTQYKIDDSVTRKKREHWIKTDADYLVLEL